MKSDSFIPIWMKVYLTVSASSRSYLRRAALKIAAHWANWADATPQGETALPRTVGEMFFHDILWPGLEESERTLTFSQTGPLLSVALVFFKSFDGSTLSLSACSSAAFDCPFPVFPQLPEGPSCRRPWPPPSCMQEYWAQRMGEQPREFVVRRGHGSAPTRSSATWTWPHTTTSMGGALKERGRLRPICFSTSSQFDFGQFRPRAISTLANFDFRPISTSGNFGSFQFRLRSFGRIGRGRLSGETVRFLSEMASAKVMDLPEEEQPAVVRKSSAVQMIVCFFRRWFSRFLDLTLSSNLPGLRDTKLQHTPPTKQTRSLHFSHARTLNSNTDSEGRGDSNCCRNDQTDETAAEPPSHLSTSPHPRRPA